MNKGIQIGLIVLACAGALLFALRDPDWTTGQLEPLFEVKGGFAMPLKMLGVFKAANVALPLLNPGNTPVEVKPVEVDPDSADEAFIAAFERYVHEGDDKALVEMAAKARHTSDPAVMLSVLAWAYVSDGNWDKVVESFRQAAALKPDDPGIKLNLARALIQKRQYEEGGRLIEEVLAKDPENLIAKNAKRWLERRLKRKEKKAKDG